MKRLPLIMITLLLALSSCSKTPDYVISESDMAELIADIHEADAVITFEKDSYSTDSAKMALRNSVFSRHGITEEQFDTSLVWYGHNLDIYSEVYEEAIDILKERQKEIIAEAKEAGERMTLSGDSVDIWTSGRHTIFDRKRVGDYAQLSFSINADENNRAGDRYEWRFILYALDGGDALIGVDYSDGSSEYHTQKVKPEETTKMTLQSDSTLHVSRIYGYLLYTMKDEDAVFADSIMLYRSRLNKERYNYHNFQRKVKNKNNRTNTPQ